MRYICRFSSERLMMCTAKGNTRQCCVQSADISVRIWQDIQHVW